MITAERVREALSYDPMTGEFVWLIGKRGTSIGTKAGCVEPTGYVRITIDQHRLGAHRVAWLHFTGQWPANDIDHINGARADNRIANLREATRAQNICNSPLRKDNVSGFKGVSWIKKAECWRATITVNGKNIVIGSFACRLAAHEAYKAAAVEHHKEFANFGNGVINML